ncbi:MAG: PEP-CTERM/exosortase system-associated acyltransferase [Nitrosomonas sp.]|nr:PEP-CTERM/exosortase system-associated acyltransferase [Nitrosomonas sp.]MDP1950359.1 PEP-CTERM/exosortase system-associated acyltransferase [Nitrosomonas sp.]
MNSLYEKYHEFFEIVIADTPELLQEVFRIRYQLICVDMRVPEYDPSLYPDGQEKDNYDNHSAHVLIRYRPSGESIGTVRLIISDPEDPEKPFPIELHTKIDPALFDIKKLSRRHTGEISRFMIIKKFDRSGAERRSAERRITIGNTTKTDRRTIKNLTIVLMAGVVRLCAKHNISNWLAIMEPSLNRLFGYYGLNLNPIGPITDHYGLRQPYFIKLTDVLDKMAKEHHDAWEVVTERGKHCHFLKNSVTSIDN